MSPDEAPCFVDPSAEDPEPYITYREHVPVAIGGNTRGEQTIDALGLRRPELNTDREEHLERLRMLQEITAKAVALLTKATAVQAEYSLMCRVAFGAQRSPSV